MKEAIMVSLIKRNESPLFWNFEVIDIDNSEAYINKPEIRETAQQIIKWTQRSIELNGKDKDTACIMWSLSVGGGVSVSPRKTRTIFNSGNTNAVGERNQKAAMWALQTLVIPEILKRNPDITEYGIEVNYNRIFEQTALGFYYRFV